MLAGKRNVIRFSFRSSSATPSSTKGSTILDGERRDRSWNRNQSDEVQKFRTIANAKPTTTRSRSWNSSRRGRSRRADADWITRETVESFRDHINPGFLEYRKATSVDGADAVVEWADAGPNSYRDVTGREYIDCLGRLRHLQRRAPPSESRQSRHGSAPTAAAAQPGSARSAARDARQSADDADAAGARLSRSFATAEPKRSKARSNSRARSTRSKQTIVAATKGFHGKSYGSLSASAKAEFRRPFGPMLPNIEHVPFNDLPALADMMTSCKAVGEDVGAVLLEPIQGEGGVNIPSRRVSAGRARALRRVRLAADPRRSADRHGPHRQDVLLRALRRRARPHVSGQGVRRRRHAGRRGGRTARRSSQGSSTIRSCTRPRSAAIRWPARRRWRRSTC